MPVKLTPNGTRGVAMRKAPSWLMKIAYAVAPLFFKMRGLDTVMLTTVGARSGKEHTVLLILFPEDERSWLLVASSAGSVKHPAWYYNMARNLEKIWIETGGRKIRVEAESLTGQEREAAWDRVVKVWKGYDSYKEKTDREIPVVRLKAA